ncbi:hypothetical protein LIER_03438 [Lithospermum erythrorhizon]|uniref:Copia protein n=1 Tax=Lithospermum erythrorhizon TaxID=34254 RepID=A0AAV3NXW9_LITER
MYLTQTKYVNDILKDLKMEECIAMATPLQVDWQAHDQNSPLLEDPSVYIRLIGRTEYRSLAYTVCELKWQSYIFKDLNIDIPQSIVLRCDNQSAIHMTENSVFHERTKHIKVDCHLFRDHYKHGFIHPVHVASKDQLADVFTKSLPITMLFPLLSKMSFLPANSS